MASAMIIMRTRKNNMHMAKNNTHTRKNHMHMAKRHMPTKSYSLNISCIRQA